MQPPKGKQLFNIEGNSRRKRYEYLGDLLYAYRAFQQAIRVSLLEKLLQLEQRARR